MPSETPADDSNVTGVLDVPEIFVEGYRGAYIRAGVARLNFFSNRLEAGPLVTKRAAVILAVPLTDLREIVDALDRLLKEVEANTSSPTQDAPK